MTFKKTINNQLPMELFENISGRTVAHMDLDTFFVSVERLMNSALKDKPVIIGGTSDRGVVASCSYESRKFGVHAGMPIKFARQLCPQATFVKGDYDNYSKYSKIVTDIIADKSPVFEKASIDEHYIDLTGMDKYFGCFKWAKELREFIIKQSGLPISFGLSINKTVSKVATGESKPNGARQIERGFEKGFLAPLSIKKIPMLGERSFTMLKNMGVTKVHTLQEMPLELVQKVMGENGKSIWKKAQGIDTTPVTPYSERKSVGTETTFPVDTTDHKKMHEVLSRMVEELAFKLRAEGKLTSCVVVKLRYSNFETFTMQRRIGYTSADHMLIEPVKDLFSKLYTRRILVRLIGVRFTNLVPGHYQINLFDDPKENIDLYQAIDKMKGKYGEGSIIRCSGFK